MNIEETLKYIEQHKAVAILRLPESDGFQKVAEALYKGGIRVMEITLTMPDALKLIGETEKNMPKDMVIGVGSVINREMTQSAINAGAAFVVSPVLKKEIITTSKENGVPVMCGAFSPTEIQHAWELGSDMVKVFPANILGKEYLKAVKAPMPHLKLMPTGGVNLTNGNDWLAAGASAVGVGSALASSDDLKNKDYKAIEKKARTLTDHFKT
ncbi:bifunctional 4-hydroxy-2-oxoglutarate aldolase/2-dehydro-3-deoxy-phosphogluconate aldolase [Rhodohalobacter sp. SW132]|uniref:bifunctional 4-hydroxy-2-oxoglutarate aldolase/2-dehydro-3-deoxy-phosphogluconate aldolase n=1 Tax=Rhodohalobacter sp. SW132 TaxID=2293433 RepID=UPI000E22EFFB|nr:bifunctional 4-hydroxy-2-oxoglutarate aldolase/2-dehydro-3-deoxy-phosphogluconate aldolase [Rhodohalobacter sp. SW132]REL33452.1 bifunctional 4-hydroxy-2-oxoglutarate aldolase/2-dehydro-3-deoxy-phosphogluconate aldolase [Rhodohalobacter sp. SW132]